MQSSERAPFTPEIVSFNPEIGFMTIMQKELVNSLTKDVVYSGYSAVFFRRESWTSNVG